ncbi:Site-specific recombinase XerC [Brevundimonas diminuta]|nr:Site-specific recombinase XerC [Brevundimonas diminuta]
MATYSKLPSGTWRAQVRRKGRYICETFLKRDDARRWATEAEGRIDRGETPTPSRSARLRTFGELIDLHIEDMKSVGKAPRRSKAATLRMLKTRLGGKKIAQLDRQLFIDFGRERASEGAGPMTLSIDIGAIKLILSHAAAVHGLTVSIEAIDMARLALKRLCLIGKGVERDRRPSDEELERLISHFDEKPRQTIPMGAVIRFAIATAMRQEEIFKVVWDDYAARTKMLTIRDRKDPREKTGNDQRIPLLSVSGFDPVALIEGQRPSRTNGDLRIFPFNHRSAGTAFTRACKSLEIADLHFHDLRHEGTSRLFEAGFQIQQVALGSGLIAKRAL